MAGTIESRPDHRFGRMAGQRDDADHLEPAGNMGPRHPEDRITAARDYAPPGLVAEIEKYATGILDTSAMREDFFSLDEQAGRAAAYIFKTHRPAFMALHFACVDGMEHRYGRDADSVRLALAANDHAIGDILEAVERSGLKDSTTVIVVGDHGFSTIHQVFRPNMLIKNVPATFIASGGSAFLYRYAATKKEDIPGMIKAVRDSLDKLPKDKRELFRIIGRRELDKMGADSAAVMALSAVPVTVFSAAVAPGKKTDRGPGTGIQNDPLDGVFIPAKGGHHGYDPKLPEMYTGFIAFGPGINRGGHIRELCVTDIAPLIARLLGIEFTTPDGKLVPGILTAK
jgi:predicted AlkP superfamily pyrophosphatase or phosphodiesterase